MNNEILWLIRLGLDARLFDREQALGVMRAVGKAGQLMDFAQKLIDDGIVTDVEKLETIAGNAMARAAAGPPPGNPLLDENQPAMEATPGKAATLKGELNAAAPKFPFKGIASLDDPALAAALRQLLIDTGRFGASDLHLSAGSRPFIRKHRALASITDHTLTEQEALRLNTVLLAEHQKNVFLERRDYDLALALGPENRYRVNLMFHKWGASGSYRMVPAGIPKLDDLGLRNLAAIRKLLSYHNGLILITGPVGAGKTTTLAAMVAELNEQRSDHIITVEDPIEVVQTPKGCNVTQREVGPHTKSFFTALKGALREDPDVIVIGELRDLETIEMAISASETGHLVIGTMHTSDAATTLNRLLDVFPPAQQTQIRASVAESLRGVVCQRLLPSTEGGLVVACEIMISITAIQALIRDGKTAGLRNVMETGVKEGMCVMENVVLELYNQKKISKETALLNVSTRNVRQKIEPSASTAAPMGASAAKK
ncbi:PilT/PilU family type 4a pilus ATPase [Opitutus sp. GAS368]|uniref:type IV pilus twitching motility protein PilT n=1 Tax=Opitutus sp. GAS368 TaxID=1882749 RepID=UPI00087D2DDF|nr:PilT/PilU family type 4a pilus ATPase [Opitutus sp. GAS368]SDR79180.1 twitching motility protein PilT [Opitutus sp. GAS368]